MSKIIYENTVKNIGDNVTAFGGEMMVLFGDSAPDTLKDFCYTIEAVETKETLVSGQHLEIKGETYEILAVGEVAEKNLVDLGHLTIIFSGDKEGLLPGAIVVEKKTAPEMKIGTQIKILA